MVARREPSRRLAETPATKPTSEPVTAPTKGTRSARARRGHAVAGRLDFGAARAEGSTYTDTPDDGASAPATLDADVAATLAGLATATSPAPPAPVEVRRCGTAYAACSDSDAACSD